MDLGGTLRLTNVIWVSKIKGSVMLVSVIEKKGFDVAFQDGKALIKPRGYSSKKSVFFGVRERKIV
jgi:hypothetical protein